MTLAAGGKIDVTDVTGLGITLLQSGITAWSISAATLVTLTITFPTTFGAVPSFVATLRSTSSGAISATVLVVGISSTSATVQVRLAASGTASGDLHWIAVD
jgi:hypothetical protein